MSCLSSSSALIFLLCHVQKLSIPLSLSSPPQSTCTHPHPRKPPKPFFLNQKLLPLLFSKSRKERKRLKDYFYCLFSPFHFCGAHCKRARARAWISSEEALCSLCVASLHARIYTLREEEEVDSHSLNAGERKNRRRRCMRVYFCQEDALALAKTNQLLHCGTRNVFSAFSLTASLIFSVITVQRGRARDSSLIFGSSS